MIVGRLFSFWEGPFSFSRAKLNLRGVHRFVLKKSDSKKWLV